MSYTNFRVDKAAKESWLAVTTPISIFDQPEFIILAEAAILLLFFMTTAPN